MNPFTAILRRLRGTIRYQNLFERMLKFALRGLNIGGETGSEQNGERRAAEFVRGMLEGERPPLYVFDVGANRGSFSRMILTVFANTNVEVHAFEPSRTLFEDLSRRMADRRLVLNAVALSDKTGEGTLHTSPLHPSLGSLHVRQISADTSLPLEERVALDTLDRYCQTHDVKHIHFLKLDVEGHEMAVLRGASAMLSFRAREHHPVRVWRRKPGFQIVLP